MGYSWWGWLLGVAVLALAGFATSYLPRRRAQARARSTAWSAARAAIETAGISRDAAPVDVPQAEQLLQTAELIAARHGGKDAAENATCYARQADELWRKAAGERD
jgi:hypothetical protein